MEEADMIKRAVSCVLALAIAVVAVEAGAIELRFQTGHSANLFWMVDQMSRWDRNYTSRAYRKYWQTKLEFNDQDLAVLEAYARLRRKHARLEDKAVRTTTSPWVSLFGRTTTLPHEQFALAFLETRTPADAAVLLKLSPMDTKVIIGALKHFARKFKDEWPRETAHLKGFSQKATVLVSLADAPGFIDQMRSFLGVRGAVPQAMPIDVLWAPPGFVKPTHLDYHIILPVSVDQAETDEAVLQHLSKVIQETGSYFLSKLPPEYLSEASRRLLRECGYVNPASPDVMKQALLVAMGEILFLRDRFPDLPGSTVLVPYDSELEYPYAVDELAREFAESLKIYFRQPSGFYPGFLDKAIEIQKRLFPPRPRFFASTGVLFAGAEGKELFDGLFGSDHRLTYDGSSSNDFLRKVKAEPGRTVFIVVTAKQDGMMWKALKGMKNWRALSKEFKRTSKKSFIYPIKRTGAGQIFVIRGLDLDGVRKALITLYNMQGMPVSPVFIE